MKLLSIVLLTLVSSMALAATDAKIVTQDDNGKTAVIALDSKGTPRVDAQPNSYPTIKDFRDDTEYSTFCYLGSLKNTKALLSALVESANGDGDSWAELVSMKQNRKGAISVVAKLTDEGGEREESFLFKRCK